VKRGSIVEEWSYSGMTWRSTMTDKWIASCQAALVAKGARKDVSVAVKSCCHGERCAAIHDIKILDIFRYKNTQVVARMGSLPPFVMLHLT